MDLKQYDGKCVRIIDAEGNVFDGICRYDYAEYNEAEWGRNEDCLRIEGFSFFQGDIQSVESLEEHEGPYGRFLDPYGKLEEMTVEARSGRKPNGSWSCGDEPPLDLNMRDRYM